MIVIDGRKIARRIINRLKNMPRQPAKIMVVVLVGDDKESWSFWKQQKRIIDKLDLRVLLLWQDRGISSDELVELVADHSRQPTIGGVTVLFPLPKRVNRQDVIKSIYPHKDINCLNPKTTGVLAPAAAAVKKILKSIDYDMSDKRVAVVGRSLLLGRPIAKWLAGKVKDMTVFHSKSDLGLLNEFDLVISCVGKPGLIKPAMLKPDTGVIDFGCRVVNKKLYGDFDARALDEAENKPAFYTPTPGGTGRILAACLFDNFFKLNT